MVSDRKSPHFRGIILLLLGAMLLGLTGCEKTREEKTLCLGVDVAKYQGTVNLSLIHISEPTRRS